MQQNISECKNFTIRHKHQRTDTIEKTFRQIWSYSTVVDYFMHILHIDIIHFLTFFNNISTSYPPPSVDNRNSCSIFIYLLKLRMKKHKR